MDLVRAGRRSFYFFPSWRLCYSNFPWIKLQSGYVIIVVCYFLLSTVYQILRIYKDTSASLVEKSCLRGGWKWDLGFEVEASLHCLPSQLLVGECVDSRHSIRCFPLHKPPLQLLCWLRTWCFDGFRLSDEDLKNLWHLQGKNFEKHTPQLMVTTCGFLS